MVLVKVPTNGNTGYCSVCWNHMLFCKTYVVIPGITSREGGSSSRVPLNLYFSKCLHNHCWLQCKAFPHSNRGDLSL
ncbi:hypothetical protein XENTR_v10022217 [Xenopus tropicalis]|nr:hypothetical protein XENTR_v10022217 [Xenopus tropicalis]